MALVSEGSAQTVLGDGSDMVESVCITQLPRRTGVVAFTSLVVIAWLIFHGAPMLGLELSPLGELIPVEIYAWAAFVGLGVLLVGIALGARAGRAQIRNEPRDRAFRRVVGICSRYLLVSALPLCAVSTYFALETNRLGYGSVDPYPTWLNLLLYVNLTLLPVVLWSKTLLRDHDYYLLLAAITAPRLLISLTGPRFFVMQAVIPIALWEATYLRRLSVAKTFAAFAGAIVFFFYVVPAFRGDEQLGFEHVVAGSPVLLVPQFEELGVLEGAPAGLVPCEIVANSTGVDLCDLRSFFGVPVSVPVRIDQAANFHLREIVGLDSIGTGGNPILEAFPRLTLNWNIVWFIAVGFLAGFVVRRMHVSPLCCFLMPHVAAKCLFLWRGTLSEFFDRLPLIIVAYAAVLIVSTRVGERRC